MFAAVLDTCVLWPSLQRDFLLSMAVEGLYRPLWSEVILDELEFHEAAKLERRGHSAAAAQAAGARLVGTMREHFDDALVTGWEPLEGAFSLPDPDDEHVVAAAVVGGAGVIVTLNRKDFPRERVPGNIRVISPAEFAGDTVSVSPAAAARAVDMLAARLARPPMTADEVLDQLVTRYGMDDAVALLRDRE
ncbi:PIN domain-containing protein [Rhodococcus koreensis]|uniref:Predicted nucleic acid-binding protein, contains PIN domain n=1 Tax=Rhodococcus koreensis TaxID=99653 RepID=A0A1H4M8F3_9NOCA|nr:PIN domain-containing protein [Rhodococcus koreensis]QSE84637.1 PIN domain-containing protein [Rhodococcus koreensis]SEB79028.1 Predicted nucleic acid-binding protein, contains PIN domain [Rhodococcus koreensis]